MQDERAHTAHGAPAEIDPATALAIAAMSHQDCETPAWALGEARALQGVPLRETVAELSAIALRLPRRSQRQVYAAIEALVDGWFGGIQNDTGYLDPLTGLPNSAFFSVRAAQLVSRDGADRWATLAVVADHERSPACFSQKIRLAAVTSNWFTGTDTIAAARSGELLVLTHRHDRLVDEAIGLERAALDLLATAVEVTILTPRVGAETNKSVRHSDPFSRALAGPV